MLLTTYDMLRCEAARLGKLGFSLVVADEVHKLKNQRSATYAAATSLPTTLRYGLTGTPMQNRLGSGASGPLEKQGGQFE